MILLAIGSFSQFEKSKLVGFVFSKLRRSFVNLFFYQQKSLFSNLLYSLAHCLPFLISCQETQPVQLNYKKVEAELFGVGCSLSPDVQWSDPVFWSYHYGGRSYCLVPA